MLEMKVYDPRDPAQSFSDPKTWKPTRNSALILAHVGFDGLMEPRDWESVITAANWCEQEVHFKCA